MLCRHQPRTLNLDPGSPSAAAPQGGRLGEHDLVLHNQGRLLTTYLFFSFQAHRQNSDRTVIFLGHHLLFINISAVHPGARRPSPLSPEHSLTPACVRTSSRTLRDQVEESVWRPPTFRRRRSELFPAPLLGRRSALGRRFRDHEDAFVYSLLSTIVSVKKNPAAFFKKILFVCYFNMIYTNDQALPLDGRSSERPFRRVRRLLASSRAQKRPPFAAPSAPAPNPPPCAGAAHRERSLARDGRSPWEAGPNRAAPDRDEQTHLMCFCPRLGMRHSPAAMRTVRSAPFPTESGVGPRLSPDLVAR